MINLVEVRGAYRYVQQQLWGTIATHLPKGAWTSYGRDYAPGALNFSMFIDLDSDVLMSHGAADKNYLWRKRPDGTRALTAGHRTDVLVPGPMLHDRVVASESLALDAEHVHSVGWPRLDLLIPANQRARPRWPWTIRRRRPRVLWAPTHDFVKHGKDRRALSSYPAFLPYVDALSKYCDVKVSPHPRNRSGKVRRPTTTPLLEADVVISDFGTMVYEAWALDKVVVFPDWLIGRALRRRHRGAAEHRIYTERIGLHADSFDELVEMVLQRPPADARQRAFLATYLDPRHRTTSGKRIADLLLRLDRERTTVTASVSRDEKA